MYHSQVRGKTHLTQKTLPGNGVSQAMSDSFKKIGSALRVARKERGLRTADVATELRISADYLRLLETGDFDQLPAPTYVSGFLRSYGKFLGLDGADLASRFYAIKGDASSTINYKMPVTAGPPQRSAPAVASLFVVLALIGYGGWYWISGPTTPDATAESELALLDIDNKKPGLMEKNAIGQKFETVSQTTAGIASGDQGAPVIIGKDDVLAEKTLPATTAKVDNGTFVGSNVLNDADNAARTNNLASVIPDSNKPVMNGATAEAVIPNIAAATSSPLAVVNGNASTQPVTMITRRENINELAVTPDPAQQLVPGRAAAVATSRDPDQEVTIRASASSWVEIVRGDGTAVLRKLMKAGETYVVDDGSLLYLSTGNAGGIELVTAGNNIIKIGTVGEIVRDLPLAKNRLRERF